MFRSKNLGGEKNVFGTKIGFCTFLKLTHKNLKWYIFVVLYLAVDDVKSFQPIRADSKIIVNSGL